MIEKPKPSYCVRERIFIYAWLFFFFFSGKCYLEGFSMKTNKVGSWKLNARDTWKKKRVPERSDGHVVGENVEEEIGSVEEHNNSGTP